jgi:hypothetical protein
LHNKPGAINTVKSEVINTGWTCNPHGTNKKCVLNFDAKRRGKKKKKADEKKCTLEKKMKMRFQYTGTYMNVEMHSGVYKSLSASLLQVVFC